MDNQVSETKTDQISNVTPPANQTEQEADAFTRALDAIPLEIDEIFGEPDFLNDEDADNHRCLTGHLALAIKPRDIVEWIWIRHVADLTFEIQNYRRYKTPIIGVAHVRHAKEVQNSYAFSGLSEEDRKKKLSDLQDFIVDQAIVSSLPDLDHVDRLIASAERRLNATLREIEFRRRVIAARVLDEHQNRIAQKENLPAVTPTAAPLGVDTE
jgi:hypothetical protein